MSGTLTMMFVALGVELVLLLLALLAFSWFRNRAAVRRDHKAIQALVKRIKSAKAERETAIERFLSERMGMSGAVLEQTKTAMLRAELVLLQRFASVYKKRDAGAAAQFDIDLTAALVPYFELQANGEGAPPVQADVDKSELEAMRAENRRLSEELTVTMETMSRMLNEYSTMFAGGAPGQAPPIASLAGGNETPDDRVDAAEGDPSTPASPVPAAVVEDSVEEPQDEEVTQDDIDVLFSADDEVVVESPEPVDGLADAAQPLSGSAEQPAVDQGDVAEDANGTDVSKTIESGTQDDGAAAVVESVDDLAVPAAEPEESLFGIPEAEKEPVDEPTPSVDESPEVAEVQLQVEPGDDLDSVNELLEEGEVEVMAFDEGEEFDVELAMSEEDLFDSAEPAETKTRAEAALGVAVDDNEVVEEDGGDELFDAGEELFDAGDDLFDAGGDEPLKTQAGG